MTDELLDLLWLVEHSLELEPKLAELLDRVVNSPVFYAKDIPQPTSADREAPEFAELPSQNDLFETGSSEDDDG